ncbi:MAG: DUF4423 domain-containing protein, partial [Bdellovibrionales bacterium]|nr:DUF4423 domain-containing protein [Bdellovibrionales bacterium]
KKILKYSTALSIPEELTQTLVQESLTDPSQFAEIEISQQEVTEEALEFSPTWVHFIIPQMTKIRGFDGSAAWIAKGLGLSPDKVDEALKQLESGGFINWVNGKIQSTGNFVYTLGFDDKEKSKSIFKNIVKKCLSMASHSLDQMDKDWQNMTHSGNFVAGYAANVPYARKRLMEMRRELISILESAPEGSEPPDMLFNVYIGAHEIKDFSIDPQNQSPESRPH